MTQWKTTLTFLAGFAAGLVLVSGEGRAQEPACPPCPECVCPEPPPCDGMPNITELLPVLTPDQKAIDKAFELIEKAEDAEGEE